MHPDKEMAETKKENGLCKRELEKVAHRKRSRRKKEGGRKRKSGQVVRRQSVLGGSEQIPPCSQWESNHK